MDFLPNGIKGAINRFWSGRTDRFTSSANLNGTLPFQPGQPSFETIIGREAEIYGTTGPVKMVINRKAEMFANGKWKNYKINPEDGTKEDLGITPLIQKLNRPNVLQTGTDFLIELMLFKSVYGFDPVYKLDSGLSIQKVPSQIWNIDPGMITIELTGKLYKQTDINEIIKSFTYDKDGAGEVVFQGNEIMYIRQANAANPILPESPLVGLSMEISNLRGAMGFRSVVIRENGGIGIISNETKDAIGSVSLTEEEEEDIYKTFQKTNGISDEQRKIILSSKNLKYTPMVYPTNKMELFPEVASNLRKIMDTYGLNENIFSTEGSSSLAESGTKIKESEKIIYQDTIMPEAANISEDFSDYLGETAEGRSIELDYSHLHLFNEDEEKAAKVVERKAKAISVLMSEGVGYSRQEAEDFVNQIED